MHTHRKRKHAHYDTELHAKDRRQVSHPVLRERNYLPSVFVYLTSHKQAKLLDQWTQFLIQDSLIPDNQISTDDFAGPLANQTNLGECPVNNRDAIDRRRLPLAIKGIIGIEAMAAIEGLLGNTVQSSNYSVHSPFRDLGRY
jgi:hypothetical protein